MLATKIENNNNTDSAATKEEEFTNDDKISFQLKCLHVNNNKDLVEALTNMASRIQARKRMENENNYNNNDNNNLIDEKKDEFIAPFDVNLQILVLSRDRTRLLHQHSRSFTAQTLIDLIDSTNSSTPPPSSACSSLKLSHLNLRIEFNLGHRDSDETSTSAPRRILVELRLDSIVRRRVEIDLDELMSQIGEDNAAREFSLSFRPPPKDSASLVFGCKNNHDKDVNDDDDDEKSSDVQSLIERFQNRCNLFNNSNFPIFIFIFMGFF